MIMLMTVLQLIIIFAAASCRGEIPRGKGHSRDWQGGQNITIVMLAVITTITTIITTIIIEIIIRWNGWFHTRWTFSSLRRFSNNDWSFQPPRSSSCSSMVDTIAISHKSTPIITIVTLSLSHSAHRQNHPCPAGAYGSFTWAGDDYDDGDDGD